MTLNNVEQQIEQLHLANVALAELNEADNAVVRRREKDMQDNMDRIEDLVKYADALTYAMSLLPAEKTTITNLLED